MNRATGIHIGIMQGRLLPPLGDRIQVFPRDGWEREFLFATEAGLEFIEWVYDRDDNPLATADGITRVQELSARHGVAVRSVCADYFMDTPPTPEKLAWFLGQCQQLGIHRVVLPFVDQSSMRSAADQDRVVETLRCVEQMGVELHLETDLQPKPFRAFLDRLPAVKVNYDTGNSASLGYRPGEEFAAYGERVGSVHIKDRKRGGGTVPLGTGDTDFPAVFAGLTQLGYSGDFVLQVARGAPGDEVAWAVKNREFVERGLGSD